MWTQIKAYIASEIATITRDHLFMSTVTGKKWRKQSALILWTWFDHLEFGACRDQWQETLSFQSSIKPTGHWRERVVTQYRGVQKGWNCLSREKNYLLVWVTCGNEIGSSGWFTWTGCVDGDDGLARVVRRTWRSGEAGWGLTRAGGRRGSGPGRGRGVATSKRRDHGDRWSWHPWWIG